MNNPYNPSFGLRPERFLGRDLIINEIESSVINRNSPWRTTLLTGVRGSGKTAILSDLHMRFKDKDAIVILATPMEGFLEDILGQLHRQLPKSIINKLPKTASVGTGFGASFEMGKKEDSPNFTLTFRYQITTMLEETAKRKKRIVILIDEVQKHSPEMRVFVATYQQLLMEGFEITLVMAGLPSAINDILNDDILTFFRRAMRITLDYVDFSLVENDYAEMFGNTYSYVSSPVIRDMALATKGYPYLIQLIGYYMWESMKREKDVKKAYKHTMVNSKSSLYSNVHQLIYSELSNEDKRFIKAMAEDEEVSKVSELIMRLEKSSSYISRYRSRLIVSGVIKSVGYGELAFAIPYMKEFILRSNY
jgi:AAA+ ATPase superfamily predicted ATPase